MTTTKTTTRKPRPYFTLLERAAPGEPFSIQFGDYDRSVVSQEMQDQIDSHYPTGRRMKIGPQWRILRTPDAKRATIDAAVAQLNAGLAALQVSNANDKQAAIAEQQQAAEAPEPLHALMTDAAQAALVRTLTWNTKRAYTAEGQVITMRVDFATRLVRFNDHSRGISGLCRNQLPSRFSVDVWDLDLREWLDCEYLHNRYDYDRTGEADALKRVEG